MQLARNCISILFLRDTGVDIMLFSSISFLYYFVPILFFIYFLVPFKFKNFVLLVTSLFFYFWGEPIYVFLMIGISIVGYVFGLLTDRYRENKKLSKFFMLFSVVISFLTLGFFKYADFVIENINGIFKTNIELLKIALPIGISFYTFQIASYNIDLYRGNVKVQKNLVSFMTYVSMFPQLIAGPIVRYQTVEKELYERKVTVDDVGYGIRRFVLGLAKKVLIANLLGEFCDISKTSTEQSVLFVWTYVIAYALHIYFDFSGYSDMAIGLGRILGFHFPENFDYPYISNSITEFWRRWHITLSTWFRDYVYIPLGGNRVSKIKWLRNIVVVWALTGLWHGASWNFVIWGLFFAVFLIIEKLFLYDKLNKIPKIFSKSYTLILVLISWIIFDAASTSDIATRVGMMFGFGNVPFSNFETLYYIKSYAMIFIIGIIGATPCVKNIINKLRENKVMNKVLNVSEMLVLLLLLVVSTAYLVDGSFNPFLYFRF